MSTATGTTTKAFERGLAMGKQGIFRGAIPISPTENELVGIIRNLIEFSLEGHLTEEQLRQDVGIVVGVVSSNPHVFCRSNG